MSFTAEERVRWLLITDRVHRQHMHFNNTAEFMQGHRKHTKITQKSPKQMAI